MKKKGINTALDLLLKRTNFLETILIVFLLALGINMLASYIQNKISDNATIIIGITLCIVPLGYLFKKLILAMQRNITISGFLVIDKKNNTIFPVTRYAISENICSYLKDAFAENSAYKSIWETDKLTNNFDVDEKTGEFIPKCPHAYKLINEAIEYYVLNTLSTTLKIHFNTSKIDSKKIIKGQGSLPVYKPEN